MWQAKADFINMVNSSQTIILVGETGSGKTTQIAQFIAEVRGGWEMGWCCSRIGLWQQCSGGVLRGLA